MVPEKTYRNFLSEMRREKCPIVHRPLLVDPGSAVLISEAFFGYFGEVYARGDRFSSHTSPQENIERKIGARRDQVIT
ncbi:hypothetical protein TNCT_503501 [Trichonephila clavata]|uniref:Uncharacterized protein n=1 Tax=Trichonephila clavata TaxID=2740835 RepID=A0A8X6JHS3_TRICU|nr:hypothetical protein TNCT_503501 [Trichonephila clavata]